MKNKIMENMELKLYKLRKDLSNATEKVNFLIKDISKLKASEEANSEG